jgi:hypothetical protein
MSHYNKLEDDDRFEYDIIPLTVHEDFTETYSKWYSGQHDPLYAVLSRVYLTPSRHQEWTGELDPPHSSDYPRLLIITQEERDRILEVSQEISNSHEATNFDIIAAKKYYEHLIPTVNESRDIESPYDNLEDSDRFGDVTIWWDGRDGTLHEEGMFTSWADAIHNAKSFLKHGGRAMVTDERGRIIWDSDRDIDTVNESSYDNLEDDDRFGPPPCDNCHSNEADMPDWAWCDQCGVSLCDDCGWAYPDDTDWLFLANISPAIPAGLWMAWCPRHKEYAPPNTITPKQYKSHWFKSRRSSI